MLSVHFRPFTPNTPIPQHDSTAPTLAFGAGQPGGANVTVSDGGSEQSMRLISKSGALNLLVTANDPESGLQAVEIWVEKTTSSCDANESCTVERSVDGKPRFDFTSPPQQPGETTAASRILAQLLNLSEEIPQRNVPPGESLTVTLVLKAVAVNNLGGRTQTPWLTATWSEP